MKKFIVPGKKLPRVGALCYKAGCSSGDLFPGNHLKDLCIKSTLYGTCFERCDRKHLLVIDEEANTAMSKLKPVIDNPNLVLQVNN